ncbi:phage head spike fiber domain-containing protein [Dyadobacter sandarakinus]|uniref:Heparin lyase I family protein n=1 Tax=Dyadobacter sandarakinus TaxID=2747268 RepID=A0ABX7I1R8_9BACT|nr:heparin lyase I family protein [Dyadobacter sandarakinus]QRQ99456.1 heparin lyase I family protein [Dyadobacter sandarakinus]
MESDALSVFDFRREPTTTNNNISFSRATEASFYGADGYLHFAQPGQNWLTNSQNFISSSWTKVNVAATTPGDVISPDGSSSAGRLTENSVTGEHRFSRTVTVDQNAPVTISIFAKAGTRSMAQFGFTNGASFTGGTPGMKVDLVRGTIMSKSSNVVDAQMVDSGNGWWRLKLTAVPDLGKSVGLQMYLRNELNTVSYKGNPDSYVYVWGAQLEQGAVMSSYALTTSAAYTGLRYNYDLSNGTPKLIGTLIEPQATNSVPYSQLLSHSAWRKQYASVMTITSKAPDGTDTVFKVREDTKASVQHYIMPNPVIPADAGSVYTFSVFMKAAERTWAYFNINNVTIHFDLVNGVVGNKNDIFTPYIENAGNGWFRCAATFLLDGSSVSAKIGPEPGNGQPSYTGDGTSGILVWGAQLEKSPELTSYIRTTSDKVTRAADIITLAKPTTDDHDVFVQRKSGGFWMSSAAGNLQITPSESELQMVNFYETGETVDSKDEIAQTLFREEYRSLGDNGTKTKIFDTEYVCQSPNKPYSMHRAINKTSPIFRVQIQAGDLWQGDATNPKKKERCEMYMKNAALPFDQDVWFSYAIRIEEGAPLDLSAVEWCYLNQVHATEDPGEMSTGPVLGVRLEGADTISVYTASTLENPIKTAPTYIRRGSVTLARGVWHRIVYRARFSPYNTGQLQFWADGKEIINVSGIGIGYVDKLGPYFKFGIYRSATSPTLAVEFANVECEYKKSLSSRIANPLPIA